MALEEKRKIPTKNYIIFIVLLIITAFMLWYVTLWYKTYKAHEAQIPVISGYIGEIKFNELDSFIRDNQTFMVYIGISDDLKCREFEENLKKVVIEHNLIDRIVYLNIREFALENEDYGKLLDKKYGAKNLRNNNKRLDAVPTLAYFKDGQLYDLITDKKNKLMTVEEIEKFLNEYEIIVFN